MYPLLTQLQSHIFWDTHWLTFSSFLMVTSKTFHCISFFFLSSYQPLLLITHHCNICIVFQVFPFYHIFPQLALFLTRKQELRQKTPCPFSEFSIYVCSFFHYSSHEVVLVHESTMIPCSILIFCPFSLGPKWS